MFKKISNHTLHLTKTDTNKAIRESIYLLEIGIPFFASLRLSQTLRLL